MQNQKAKILLLLAILAAAIAAGLLNGSVSIPFTELFRAPNREILFLRALRILAAIVVGSGLAVSGIALQAVLRNPLAEPYLLGTSSGAGLGAVAATVLGLGAAYLPLTAFAGALSTVVIVYLIAREGGRIPVQSLILSGVIASLALSGIIVFLVSTSSNEAMHGLMWWLWGSLEIYDIRLLLAVSIIVLVSTGAVYILSQDLNAISIGEEEASHLGVNTEAVKKILLCLTSLMSASLVCVSGIIGFVGLIIPHALRFVVGPNHRILIPCACLGGAAFMIICDTLSRTIMAPVEIPIGVITAVLGAPIFIILLKTGKRTG